METRPTLIISLTNKHDPEVIKIASLQSLHDEILNLDCKTVSEELISRLPILIARSTSWNALRIGFLLNFFNRLGTIYGTANHSKFYDYLNSLSKSDAAKIFAEDYTKEFQHCQVDLLQKIENIRSGLVSIHNFRIDNVKHCLQLNDDQVRILSALVYRAPISTSATPSSAGLYAQSTSTNKRSDISEINPTEPKKNRRGKVHSSIAPPLIARVVTEVRAKKINDKDDCFENKTVETALNSLRNIWTTGKERSVVEKSDLHCSTEALERFITFIDCFYRLALEKFLLHNDKSGLETIIDTKIISLKMDVRSLDPDQLKRMMAVTLTYKNTYKDAAKYLSLNESNLFEFIMSKGYANYDNYRNSSEKHKQYCKDHQLRFKSNKPFPMLKQLISVLEPTSELEIPNTTAPTVPIQSTTVITAKDKILLNAKKLVQELYEQSNSLDEESKYKDVKKRLPELFSIILKGHEFQVLEKEKPFLEELLNTPDGLLLLGYVYINMKNYIQRGFTVPSIVALLKQKDPVPRLERLSNNRYVILLKECLTAEEIMKLALYQDSHAYLDFALVYIFKNIYSREDKSNSVSLTAEELIKLYAEEREKAGSIYLETSFDLEKSLEMELATQDEFANHLADLLATEKTATPGVPSIRSGGAQTR